MGLENICKYNPKCWEILFGGFFQMTECSPGDVFGNVLGGTWYKDLRKFDKFAKEPGLGWSLEQLGPLNQESQKFLQDLDCRGKHLLEAAIKNYVNGLPSEGWSWVLNVLDKAGWSRYKERQPDWDVMDDILKMPEGEEKARKMAQAHAESPRFFAECVNNPLFCGV